MQNDAADDGISPAKIIAVDISPTAADAIRHKFNPSDLGDVAKIKDLTGTLITILERLASKHASPADHIVAIRHVQTASMWSVFAATKGL